MKMKITISKGTDVRVVEELIDGMEKKFEKFVAPRCSSCGADLEFIAVGRDTEINKLVEYWGCPECKGTEYIYPEGK